MQEGLLWYDNDPKRDLAAKIKQAATRYKAKFGQQPTLCYLNAAEAAEQAALDGIELRPVADVLPHHLWLGVKAAARG